MTCYLYRGVYLDILVLSLSFASISEFLLVLMHAFFVFRHIVGQYNSQYINDCENVKFKLKDTQENEIVNAAQTGL